MINERGQLNRRRERGLQRRARHRRRNMTAAEARLWRLLRKRRVCGVPFRRHHVIGPMIVNFYCRSARLVVQVRPDGLKWSRQEEVEYLRRRGFAVLRFSETEVLERIEWVMRLIWGVCRDRLDDRPTDPPSAQRKPEGVIEVDFTAARNASEQPRRAPATAASRKRAGQRAHPSRRDAGGRTPSRRDGDRRNADRVDGGPETTLLAFVTRVAWSPLVATADGLAMDDVRRRVGFVSDVVRRILGETEPEP